MEEDGRLLSGIVPVVGGSLIDRPESVVAIGEPFRGGKRGGSGLALSGDTDLF